MDVQNIYVLIPIVNSPDKEGFYSVVVNYNKRPLTAFWDGKGNWSVDIEGSIMHPTHWLQLKEFPTERKLNHIRVLVRKIRDKELEIKHAVWAIEDLLNPLYT